MKKTIKKYLLKLRLKMFMEEILRNFLLALTCCLGFSFIILLGSRLIKINAYQDIINKYSIIIAIFFLGLSFIKFPKFNKTIMVADQLALKERLITAYELADSQEKIHQIQRDDCLKIMEQNKKIHQKYRINFNKNLLYIVLILSVLTTTTLFIETKTSIQNDETQKTVAKIKKESKKLNKELLKLAPKNKEYQAEVKKIIKNLNKKMIKQTNKKNAIKSLSVAKNKLAKLNKKITDKNTNNAINSLISKINRTGRSLSNKKISDYAFNKKNKKSSANTTNNSTNKNSSNTNKNTTSKNKNSTNSNNSQNKHNQSSNSENNTSNQTNQNNTPSSESQDNSDTSNNNSNDPNNKNNQNNQNGDSDEKKDGNANVNGNGNGNGNGKGNGNGNSKSKGNSKGSGKGGGRGLSQGDREKFLYLKNRLNMDEAKKYLKNKHKSKNMTYNKVKNLPNTSEDYMDYTAVLSELSSENSSALDKMQVPNKMKNMVKNYFNALNEEEN